MREQTKWRRVLAAALIGSGLALLGVGLVRASTSDAIWTADAIWTSSISSDHGTPPPATNPGYAPSDAIWTQ